MASRKWAWLLATAAVVAALPFTSVHAAEIDAGASRVGFTLQTRWDNTLEGRFPSIRGQVDDLGHGCWEIDPPACCPNASAR